MATAIAITAVINATQTSLTLREISGISRVGMTNIIVYLYKGVDLVFFGQYQLPVDKEADFVDTGAVELLFTDMFGPIDGVLDDGWWIAEVRATSEAYVSNQYGFGIFTDIAFEVYALVNSTHVPEVIKYKSEDLFMKVLMLDGLKYLDTSTVNDRGAKFTVRFNALTKILGI